MYEKGTDLLDFVREQLSDGFNWLPFCLKTVDNIILTDECEEKSQSLLDLRMVPASTVNFLITDEDIKQQVPTDDRQILKEIISKVQL